MTLGLQSPLNYLPRLLCFPLAREGAGVAVTGAAGVIVAAALGVVAGVGLASIVGVEVGCAAVGATVAVVSGVPVPEAGDGDPSVAGAGLPPGVGEPGAGVGRSFINSSCKLLLATSL